ncbi:MAG: TRAP transporter small permease subunit, partial [Deltaproteobacteria bacterium]|nr:TRAP transporter small permease subunit [Deltaproteobacteria bacterium]
MYSFGRSIGQAIDRVVQLSSVTCAFILAAMAVVTFYEVSARYVFNSPTCWTLDLTVHLLVWFGYLSMAYIEQKGRHIRVDLLTTQFSKRSQAVW